VATPPNTISINIRYNYYREILERLSLKIGYKDVALAEVKRDLVVGLDGVVLRDRRPYR